MPTTSTTTSAKTSKTVRKVLIEIDDTTGQNETSEPVKVDSYPIFPVAIAIISGAIVGGAAVCGRLTNNSIAGN
jgi:hypothetical protein